MDLQYDKAVTAVTAVKAVKAVKAFKRNKLERLDNCVTKILNHLASCGCASYVHLNYVKFITLEKMAALEQIENHLRLNINTYMCPERRGFAYTILVRIMDNKPTVTGVLTKMRLFDLIKDNYDGHRLLYKTHLLNLFKKAYPDCFVYEEMDMIDSEKQHGQLIKLLAFNSSWRRSYMTSINEHKQELWQKKDDTNQVIFNVFTLGLVCFAAGLAYGLTMGMSARGLIRF